LYKEVGKAPHCIVFLVGGSGMQKTTYAAFQTQLYNRDKRIEEPIRLNATISAASAILHNKHDCVTVLDDLFPTKGETKRKQEQTLTELVRIVGDNRGSLVMKDGEPFGKEPNCGVLVTGEYLIGNGSTAARLLPVEVTEPLGGLELTRCQQEPLILSTFYRYFIEWFIKNYNELKGWLAETLSESRDINFGIHARLQETFLHLDSASKIFFIYCMDKGFLTADEVNPYYLSFRDLLARLVIEQDVRTKQTCDGEDVDVDYLGITRTLYNGTALKLAGNVKQITDKHHGLIYDKYLYLQSAKIMPEIQKFNPKANQQALIKSLREQNALKVVNGKNTIQISNGGGKRFLAIPLEKLR